MSFLRSALSLLAPALASALALAFLGGAACGGARGEGRPDAPTALSMDMPTDAKKGPSESTDHFIERDGVRIHYVDEGQGLPVLLLHAYPLQGAMFRPQLAALASKYRFIVPDHRGFGKSDILQAGPALNASNATDMAQLADDALAVLDALHVEQTVVGGLSMGGYVAMALARRAPHRVKGLVLADTQSTDDDAPGRTKREEAAKKALALGMQGVADAMLPKLVAPSASPEVRAQITEWILSNTPEGAAAAQRGMARRSDSADVLSRYEGPALVIVGEKDELIPAEKAKKMAALLKNASLTVIPNAGHISNIEAPDEFNRALDAFLSKIRP